MGELNTFTDREPSITWVAWWVLGLGGLLTIAAIWLTMTNLNREVIFYVLLPGTAIGTLLMVLGGLGVVVCAELDRATDSQKAVSGLTRQIILWSAAGTVIGVALGILLGSIAIGVAVGPLFGMTFGMAVWIWSRQLACGSRQ
jgi:hypothetical protein